MIFKKQTSKINKRKRYIKEQNKNIKTPNGELNLGKN